MRVAGVDPTPTAFFRDSPVWVKDAPVQRGYWRACNSVAGDAVDPRYLEDLHASALVAERPWRALGFHQRAPQLPASDQMRVHNGLYRPVGRSAARKKPKRPSRVWWTSACARASSR